MYSLDSPIGPAVRLVSLKVTAAQRRQEGGLLYGSGRNPQNIANLAPSVGAERQFVPVPADRHWGVRLDSEPFLEPNAAT